MLSKEKKIKEDRNKDYSNGISVPEGRRGGSSSHGKFDRRCVRYERGTHGLRPSHFEEDDGHRMRDVREDPRARYNPYARSCNKRRQKWSDAHQFLVTVRRDPQSQESALAEGTQERSAQSWFKIT
ncbi:nuclear RNA export factor 1-like, partial [Fukomys damarensis]|uniref:nuclear RNA export factor 1-like n=1 Tax=Fukomys damarensis TaxID=885580 RepID=UPI00054012D2